MLGYWTSFAATGVPSIPGGPAWTPYRSSSHILRLDQGKLVYFDAVSSIIAPSGKRCTRTYWANRERWAAALLAPARIR